VTSARVLPANRRSGGATRPGLGIWLCVAGVVLSWGVSWPFVKMGVAEAGAFAFTALRAAGAGVAIAVLQLVARRPLMPPADERRGLALIGLLQVAGMLGFAAIGLQFVSSGRAVVLGYTVPLWTIPLSVWLLGERIGLRQALGAAVSIAGLLLFFNPSLVDWRDPHVLLGNGVIILGAMCWALGSCLYKRRIWHADRWAQILWQMVASSPVLALLAVAFEGGIPVSWSPTLFAILIFNWLVPMAAAFWWWGKILTAFPAATAAQFLLLTPVTGFLMSAVMTGERATIGIAVSIALIVIGLMITVGDASRVRAAAR
jgi:drug/metabolite transporter (DMT)-like permease